MNTGLLTVAGLGVLLIAITRRAAIPGISQSDAELLALARQCVQRHNFRADPVMLATMAAIESSGNPLAVRLEPQIDDLSIGLMQTLLSTAQWLARDMGYRHYGVPGYDDLIKPEVSMYFGAAYVHWLARWNGRERSEQWIVESYNGGPNNSNFQTRNHWHKYQNAKPRFMGG